MKGMAKLTVLAEEMKFRVSRLLPAAGDQLADSFPR